MTSTNDGKDVKSNQTSGPKGKSYYIELYKALEIGLNEGRDISERTQHLCEAWRRVRGLCQHSAASTQTHLLGWLERHTARTVLQAKWRDPDRIDDRKKLEDAIDSYISETEEAKASWEGYSAPWEVHLQGRGEWFKRNLENPWEHPVLTLLVNPNETPPDDDEVIKWLKEERGITLVARLRTLVVEKLPDIATTLVSAVMDRIRSYTPTVIDADDPIGTKAIERKEKPPPEEASFCIRLREEAGFTDDVWDTLTDIEFVLLHKRDSTRCIALAKQTPLASAYKLIARLDMRLETSPREKKLWKNAKEVAILIAQVVIARCMIIPTCLGSARNALYGCSRLLAQLLPSSRLPPAADVLAKQATTARHLHTLAAAVDKQLSNTDVKMKPYICELYVRAITAGMNELERLKLKTEKEGEARLMESTLAVWFVQLAEVLSQSERILRECTLTAFSLHPSQKMYDRLSAAPHPAPRPTDSDESKNEETKSEFGSWANDSRSQTNFVKTSETLKMKQAPNQTNVLSTAIFNEGEALGLNPELCQDIAVLLSGPRVKTLSWDMDRAVLMEHCRAYMDATHGGTRSLTRELKYLNIDLNEYKHLPEEHEDENDPYYGIERGYEHLIPEEPEDLWEDITDFERTESASSSIEDDFIAPRRKKKTKRVPLSSDEDSDPLSCVAEAKRIQKKKERPHSKERSKERAKKKHPKQLAKTAEEVDPLYIDGQSPTPNDKPKEKKQRKPKDKTPKLKTHRSLGSLVGLKVAKTKKKNAKMISKVASPLTDSDYDSQGKNSVTSINSESHDLSAMYDILFPPEELKANKTYNLGPTPNHAAIIATKNINVQQKASKYVFGMPPRPSTPTNSVRVQSPSTLTSQPPKDLVRATLSKLLDSRKHRPALLGNTQPNNTASPLQKKPAIIRPNIPIQSNISPKAVEIPEIPKSYINKQHAEKLAEIKREMNSLLAQSKERSQSRLENSAVPRPVIQYAKKTDEKSSRKVPQQSNLSVPYDRLMAEIAERHDSSRRHYDIVKPLAVRPHSTQPAPAPPRSFSVLTPGQRDFQNFLKQYDNNNYSAPVSAIDMSKGPAKDKKPIYRVTPLVPSVNKTKPKSTPKHSINQKKPDNTLNTFSRLSYMHKNKQTEIKNKQSEQQEFSSTTYQEVSSELDQIIKEHQQAQRRYIQSQKEPSDRLIEKPVNIQEPNRQDISKINLRESHSFLANLLERDSRSESQINKQIPQKHVSLPKQIALSEKDQNNLRQLLRQQNKHSTTNINSKPSTSSGNIATSPPTNYTSTRQKLQASTSQECYANYASILDSKIINILSNSLIKPADNIGSLNLGSTYQKPTNLSVIKNITPTVTIEKVNKVIGVNNSHVEIPAKHTPQSVKPEWQSVMSDILKHKTPTRGPNALEVALDKSSFEIAFEKSLQSRSLLETSNESITKSDKQEIPNQSKPISQSLKNVSANKGTKSQKAVPKLQKHLADLKKSNRSINENVQKQNSQIVKKDSEAQKKPFIFAGPQNCDPFISGIPNSDYDLLEELMDDDLRKEIGELSSDEESYNAAAQSFLKPSKSNEKRVSVEYNKARIDVAAKKSEVHCLNAHLSSNGIMQATNLKSVDKTTNNKKAANLINSPCFVSQQHTSTLQTSLTNQVAIDPNIYISTVSQAASVQNVVLIGTPVVYEGYSTVQAPVHTVTKISPNAYLPVNNASNINVFQSQFTAPTANPMIIASSLTVPIINNVSIQIPTNTHTNLVQPTFSFSMPSVQSQQAISERCIEFEKDKLLPATGCHLQIKQIDTSKTCERKVLSEVQELALTDAIDKTWNQKIEFKMDAASEQERIKNKRLAIINREIYHRCGEEAIPLSYSPLPQKTYTQDMNEQIDLHYTPDEDQQKPVCTKDSLTAKTQNDLRDLSDVNSDVQSPATSDSNDAKENKSISEITCRRILLRSSNKIVPNFVDTVVSTETPATIKKSKVKLKSDSIDDHTKVCAPSQTNEDKNTVVQKRASKRLRNKTVPVHKEVENTLINKRHTSISKHRNLPKIKVTKLRSKIDKHMASPINFSEIFDIEAELLGSKITKVFGIKAECGKLTDGYNTGVDIVQKTESFNDEQNEESHEPVGNVFSSNKIKQDDSKNAHNVELTSKTDKNTNQATIKDSTLIQTESVISQLSHSEISIKEDKSKYVSEVDENYISEKESVNVNIGDHKLEDQDKTENIQPSTTLNSDQDNYKISAIPNFIRGTENIDRITEEMSEKHNDLDLSETTDEINDKSAITIISKGISVKHNDLDASETEDKIDDRSEIQLADLDVAGLNRNITGVHKEERQILEQSPIKVNIDEEKGEKQNIDHVKRTDLIDDNNCSIQSRAANILHYAEKKYDNDKDEKDIDLDMSVTCDEVKPKKMDYANIIIPSKKVIRPKVTVATNSEVIDIVTTFNDDVNEMSVPSVTPVVTQAINGIEKVGEESVPSLLKIANKIKNTKSNQVLLQRKSEESMTNTQSETDLDNDDVVLINDDPVNTAKVLQNNLPQKIVETVQSEKNLSKKLLNDVVHVEKPMTKLDNDLRQKINEKQPQVTRREINIQNENNKSYPINNDLSKIPQSFKDSIQIEHIPCNDPMKNKVRVTLPNGRKCIATVHGVVHVTFDTLFNSPSIQAALINKDAKKFYFNQVTTVDGSDPTKILSTHIEDIKIKASFAGPVETIDLLSDEEDQPKTTNKVQIQTFDTEYGKYKISSIDKDMFTKHQDKLNKKSTIFLKKCDAKLMPSINVPPVPDKFVAELMNDINVQPASTPAKLVSDITEIVEIDDSSNESFAEKENRDEKINDLKNVLLQELGVVKTITTHLEKSQTEVNKPHVHETKPARKSRRNKALQPVSNYNCNPFYNIPEKEQQKIINRKCSIKLIRCDELCKDLRENISNLSDKPITAVDFPILNDIDTNIIDESRSSSPVIEFSDLLSMDKRIKSYSRIEQVMPLSCEADWHSTKATIREDILEDTMNLVYNKEFDTERFRASHAITTETVTELSYCAPTLNILVLKYLQCTNVIDQIRTHDPTLKRKSTSVETPTASKISKSSCRDNGSNNDCCIETNTTPESVSCQYDIQRTELTCAENITETTESIKIIDISNAVDCEHHLNIVHVTKESVFVLDDTDLCDHKTTHTKICTETKEYPNTINKSIDRLNKSDDNSNDGTNESISVLDDSKIVSDLDPLVTITENVNTTIEIRNNVKVTNESSVCNVSLYDKSDVNNVNSTDTMNCLHEVENIFYEMITKKHTVECENNINDIETSKEAPTSIHDDEIKSNYNLEEKCASTEIDKIIECENDKMNHNVGTVNDSVRNYNSNVTDNANESMSFLDDAEINSDVELRATFVKNCAETSEFAKVDKFNDEYRSKYDNSNISYATNELVAVLDTDTNNVKFEATTEISTETSLCLNTIDNNDTQRNCNSNLNWHKNNENQVLYINSFENQSYKELIEKDEEIEILNTIKNKLAENYKSSIKNQPQTSEIVNEPNKSNIESTDRACNSRSPSPVIEIAHILAGNPTIDRKYEMDLSINTALVSDSKKNTGLVLSPKIKLEMQPHKRNATKIVGDDHRIDKKILQIKRVDSIKETSTGDSHNTHNTTLASDTKDIGIHDISEQFPAIGEMNQTKYFDTNDKMLEDITEEFKMKECEPNNINTLIKEETISSQKDLHNDDIKNVKADEPSKERKCIENEAFKCQKETSVNNSQVDVLLQENLIVNKTSVNNCAVDQSVVLPYTENDKVLEDKNPEMERNTVFVTDNPIEIESYIDNESITDRKQNAVGRDSDLLKNTEFGTECTAITPIDQVIEVEGNIDDECFDRREQSTITHNIMLLKNKGILTEHTAHITPVDEPIEVEGNTPKDIFDHQEICSITGNSSSCHKTSETELTAFTSTEEQPIVVEYYTTGEESVNNREQSTGTQENYLSLKQSPSKSNTFKQVEIDTESDDEKSSTNEDITIKVNENFINECDYQYEKRNINSESVQKYTEVDTHHRIDDVRVDNKEQSRIIEHSLDFIKGNCVTIGDHEYVTVITPLSPYNIDDITEENSESNPTHDLLIVSEDDLVKEIEEEIAEILPDEMTHYNFFENIQNETRITDVDYQENLTEGRNSCDVPNVTVKNGDFNRLHEDHGNKIIKEKYTDSKDHNVSCELNSENEKEITGTGYDCDHQLIDTESDTEYIVYVIEKDDQDTNFSFELNNSDDKETACLSDICYQLEDQNKNEGIVSTIDKAKTKKLTGVDDSHTEVVINKQIPKENNSQNNNLASLGIDTNTDISTDDYDDIEARLAIIVGESFTDSQKSEEHTVIGNCDETLNTEDVECQLSGATENDLIDDNKSPENISPWQEDDTEILKVIMPKVTYLKDNDNIRRRRKTLKRKMDMSDIRTHKRKYRKGKNIDHPKLTAAAMSETAFAKEYKRLFDYHTSVKFSYSIPFHKDFVDVHSTFKGWPVSKRDIVLSDLMDTNETKLFMDIEEHEVLTDPLRQTLPEEIASQYEENRYRPIHINEVNFHTGFGERSGRVIQELKDGEYNTFSAATLSDVKQLQPLLPSDKQEAFVQPQNIKCNEILDEQIKKSHFVDHLNLREKVRAFFNKSKAELTLDWQENHMKGESPGWPFDLASPNFISPAPIELMVNVVQVGQLPVSAAAQNPVTCDPRVTHVSNASPSQCSPENNSSDEIQTTIKTEYTELTTADITLPLMQEYAQHQHPMPVASHVTTNLYGADDTTTATEIKSVVKIELVEESSQETFEENGSYEKKSLHQLSNGDLNKIGSYQFSHIVNMTELDQNQFGSKSSEKLRKGDPVVENKQKSSLDKADQIVNAINVAGTAATQALAKSKTIKLDALDTISQNAQTDVTTSQAHAANYSKPTTINAIALQQALAQILPPALNQTNSENQQISSNPQVLHIVQGNNTQSVINKQNGTQLLHIVQNKSASNGGTPTSQPNTFSGLSLVDGTLQQNGNQLLHIVNTGNQKNTNAGQLLKRVNLLTNLANVQGSNEQKMVQFVCKSADGKSIQLPHQRSMVLRLQPIDPPSMTTCNQNKQNETPDNNSSSSAIQPANGKEPATQEMKSRSLYEENYAKFVQNGDCKITLEKAISLPKFNQVFGKQVYQDSKSTEIDNTNITDNSECPREQNNIPLEQIPDIGNPPLLTRKQNPPSQAPPNLVQQIKQTIGPMNIQTMHGGVIYTRQIPVNIGGGQTINLITVPSTELVDDSTQKQQPDGKFGNQEGDTPIIKIVPNNQSNASSAGTSEDNNSQLASTSDTNPSPNPQPQPVLTQMRIKLPMLSKAPQIVGGTRVVRPSFFQIQRNVIGGGANQQVYQQLVLTAAPPLGQTIRLPAPTQKPKAPSETQSSPESQMSSSTLEQLREFDMVLEQVKERSTVQPGSSTSNNNFNKINSSSDTTDAPTPSTSSQESPNPVLYSVGNTQPLNMVSYVNRKSTITATTTSSFVRSPDSTAVIESPSSSTHSHLSHTVTSESCATSSCASEATATTSPPKLNKKKKPKPSTSTSNPFHIKNTPKPSSQKPLEDEQTTQRILYILAEYKEQVENSPDKDKPAPRRRNNPAAPNAGSSKRKKSSSGSRRRDMSPVLGEDSCRTMGSEDSSCGTSMGECNECLDSHSPEESPRKVVRRLTFEQETHITQTRTVPQRNVIVADGQAFAVRGATGKPATTVLMPANYLLPVSMMKGGQQIAIVTNRGPKLLVGAGEGGTGGTLLFQRLIGPAGLKPMLTRPGVRHIRLPTAALQNLHAFNIATPVTTAQPADSTASPAPAPAPPDLVDTRAMSSPWPDREPGEIKPDRGNSSPEGSEPWNLPSSSIADDYGYEEIVRTDNMDRTVLDAIPDRYSPDIEAQRIFDKMFDVDSKKCMFDSRCGYDIDASDDDKAYQVVQRKDGRQTRLTHVSAAALRHKYAILEHELRLQKSLSEECEDLGVDSPSASELFPEAELLFAPSPAHEQTIDQCNTPQPNLLSHGIPQPDLDDQIATDHLLTHKDRQDDLDINLDDVGEIVTVGEDGMTTIPLDHEEFARSHEEFARSHPNTTFHSEPEDGEIPPFTIAQSMKGRQITFHARGVPGTVVMAPQTTVISQATIEASGSQNTVKFTDIDNMINSLPGSQHSQNILPSVLVKDGNEGLSKFDRLLNETREQSNTASAIVHSAGNGTQVIRRVHYERRDVRCTTDETEPTAPEMKMPRRSTPTREHSPERHPELFWESAAPPRPEKRRFDFSSDSDKCCKSPYEETNSDSSGIGAHTRLDSVIKAARSERRRSDGSSEEGHPPLRTYPAKRAHHHEERGARARPPDRCHEGRDDSRRRASNRGVVKRGCHCCNGSSTPKPKKSRPKKSNDFP